MTDRIVLDTTERILTDLCPPEVVNDAETGVWPAALWEALEESGLTLAWVSEELGGGGAEMGDGFYILKAAGAWAVPAPLAETLLAGWLLDQVGLAPAAGRDDRSPGRSFGQLRACGRRAVRHSAAGALCPQCRTYRAAGGRPHPPRRAGVLRARAGNEPCRRGAGRHCVRRRPAGALVSRAAGPRRGPPRARRRCGPLGADGRRAFPAARPVGPVCAGAGAVRPAHRAVPGSAARARGPGRRGGGGRSGGGCRGRSRRGGRFRPRRYRGDCGRPRCARARPHRRVRPSRTKSTARWASPTNIRCTTARGGSGAGATSSAMNASGPSGSAA